MPLISIPYITRVLHPAGLGKVSFIDSLSYYFVAIAEFGIVAYGVREIARIKHDKDQLRKLVSELLVLHCLTSGVSLILYGITVFILWQKIQDIRLVLFSVSFLLVNFFACEWYFWGLEKFRYIAIRSFISRLLAIIALFILVKEPADYYMYYGIIAISASINLLTNIVNVFKSFPITLKNINWKRHVKHTWVTYFISLFYSIMVWLDNVILGIVSTAAVVGTYSVSVKMIRIAVNLFTDMFLVLYPRTATLLYEEKEKELQQTILNSVQFIILLTVPATAGIYLLSEPLVNAVLADSFNQAVENIKILSLLPFIKTYSLYLSKQILMSHGKEKLFLYSLIAGNIVYVLLMPGFSYYLNDRGACYAMVLAEIIILVISYIYVKRTFPGLKIFDVVIFLQSVLATLLFIPVIWLLKMYITSPVILLLLAVLICTSMYFLMQWLVLKNKLVNNVYLTVLSSLRKSSVNIP